MVGQTAIAANEVANLNYQTAIFYAAANNKAFFGSGGTVGTRPIGPLTRPEASSLATDTSINPFTVQAQEKSRNAYQKQLQDEQDKAAKEAIKAAKAGQKAFNTAAKEMNSMITGIVKVSEVTQQDMEDAKNGTYQDKPDEYLRQLRDEVKNKKDYKDVSIEEAAAGLNKIGIETAGKSADAVLQLFERAYSNMSLFADESNLKFINDAAVQYQIDLQEKSKQGQENIVKHFGGIVDGAVSAITGGVAASGVGGGAGGATATGVAPAINIDGQALAGNNLDIKATVTGLEIGADVDTDLSDKFSFKLTINQQSIMLTADDAQLIKDRIAGQITPKMTFNQQSIVFTADDAQIVRDRLASQMTPKISLSAEGVISADPKVMATINENLGKLLTPKIWVTDEGGINADPVKIETIKTNLGDALTPTINPIIEVTQQEQDLARVKIEQSIMPTLRPILGDPTQQEIVAYQQRLDSLVKEKPVATLAGQGGLGNLLVRNGKETGEEKNPLAGDYISSLTDSFNTPENVLALATIGTGIRGAIDSGIRTAPTGDVGTEIIALINGQFFSEANVITIKSIGNNVFELIIAGIRLAMQKKNNNVGQEIVNTIAAQVVSATADAISGE